MAMDRSSRPMHRGRKKNRCSTGAIRSTEDTGSTGNREGTGSTESTGSFPNAGDS